MMMAVIAAVRLRGIRNIKPKLKRTLEMLRLESPNNCVVVSETPQMMGMLYVVKDYIAFGNIGEETVHILLKKRGRKGSRSLSLLMKDEELKAAAKQIAGGKRVRDFSDPVFRLHPPKKGLKDLKRAWPMGDLGQRGDMDSLIKRMV